MKTSVHPSTLAAGSGRSSRVLQPGAFKRSSKGWNSGRQQSLSRHLQGRLRAAVADTNVQVERAVRFSIQQRVEFGESMRVVGGSEQFGSWNPEAAPLLEWGEGHVWTWDGKLPVGEYEFKVVITRQEGSPSWEDGDNRKLTVTPGDSVVEVNMNWGAVYDTVVNEVPVEVTSGVEEPEAKSESESNGNGASNGVSTDDAESAESTVPDTIPAALVESALERELAAAGEKGPPSSSQEAVPMGAADAFVNATTVIDLPESEASSSLSDSPTGTMLATALASATAKQLDNGKTSGSEDEWAGVDPVGGVVDSLMAAVTFAAVPVVGWSLYTLHSTGCGLPPGPSGALGAAEGLSYLGVTAMAGYSLFKRATGSPSPGYAVAAEVLSYSTIAAGLAVLAAQLQNYGYIPSALPDANCYGPGSSTPVSLPPIPLPDLSDSLKQASSALEGLKSQLPTVDTEALRSQTTSAASEALRQLQAATSASQAAISSQAQTLGTQLGSSVNAGLSKAQELSTRLGSQAGALSTQLWLRVDGSLQAVPGQLQQLTGQLPSAADISEKVTSSLSSITAKLPQ